ncbi:phospholipase B1, membrane-associated isoform X2 [Nilaparvata lugens]|nr:phospholipase B1, membrane-associated isoform X2 [Nilaparvata lugens]
MLVWCLIVLVSAFGGGECEDMSGLPKFMHMSTSQFRHLRDTLLNIIGRTTATQPQMARLSRMQMLQPSQENKPFPCNTTGYRSSSRPTSVHQLMPGDIDIIGALGDSLTAGNGAAATNVFQVYTENRGISWSIGGQGTWREFLTLPNIIKEFNPNLIGYSLKDSFTHHKASQFNAGEIGAMSRDVPYMATILVKRMKNDKRVDFKNDWKLVTLMIGSNDFCVDVCYMKQMTLAPELHRRDLIKTITYLRDNLPRTILQIVVAPNLEVIMNFTGLPMTCRITQTSECPCLIGLPFRSKRKTMLKIMDEWQKVEMEVAMDPKFTTDDFAVVYQPFTAELTFPTRRNSNGEIVTDTTYLSKDCFHFSQKGYSRASNALWNNLLEPVGGKTTNWQTEFTRFLCPSQQNPYIYTNRNSLKN